MQYLQKIKQGYSDNKWYIRQDLALLGLAFVMRNAYRFGRIIWDSVLRPDVNISARYGRGCYAIVTGGASGIGRAFSLDLASRGINLIIIDFNQQAMDEIKTELQKLYPKIDVKMLLKDFFKGKDPNFYQELYDEVKSMKLDVGILINNVGGGKFWGSFTESPNADQQGVLHLNLYPSLYMTKMFLPDLQKRNHKSLLLNVSSVSALVAFPYLCAYGTAKRFVYMFTKSIAYDQKEKKTGVDVLALCPDGVLTPLTKGFPSNPWMINPDECVASVWKQVGRSTWTVGSWKHRVKYEFIYPQLFSI